MRLHCIQDVEDLGEITGTPQFIARPLLGRLRVPSLDTEVESLMYCFLYAATRDRLHWKRGTWRSQLSEDAKDPAMA